MGATGQLIPAMAAMITDLVFERFPRLKMVAVEAGCGWAAYLMDRLDEKHDILRAMLPAPMPLKPSDYIRRNCWFVAEPDELVVARPCVVACARATATAKGSSAGTR